eukprot:1601162-Prymnesium_polylepis.1
MCIPSHVRLGRGATPNRSMLNRSCAPPVPAPFCCRLHSPHGRQGLKELQCQLAPQTGRSRATYAAPVSRHQ